MKKPGPRLQKLIESGDAYMNQPNPIEIENYLKEYPTQEDW